MILNYSGDELKEILGEFLSDIRETLDSGVDLSDLDELTPDYMKSLLSIFNIFFLEFSASAISSLT